MKAHVGVDSKTKIIHTAVATAANVADSTVLPDLLHGEETRVWGDQAYRGQTQVIKECAPHAQDHTHRRYRYKNGIDQRERAKNRTKSTVRSKVEHVFQVMKLKRDCTSSIRNLFIQRVPSPNPSKKLIAATLLRIRAELAGISLCSRDFDSVTAH
jgi:IS5 family transposase